MSTSTFGTTHFTSTAANGDGIASRSLGKPAAVYPGGIATDAQLKTAVDRLQTKLTVPLDTVSTSMTVASASAIVANVLLSIDNEIVWVTGAPAGNVVPISRGFDGTVPTIHLASALVSGFVDAWHHNTLVAEIEAIETALGANLSKITASPFVLNTACNFAAQTPGGSLVVGANSFTLTPVPAGVSGTDTGHYVWISGGTGAAEAALIIGGSAVGGSASGNLIIQCANTHTGAWTISSATGGIQEAICSLPAAGGGVIVNSSVTLQANVGPCGKTSVVIDKMAGMTIAGSFTLFGQSSAGDGRSETFCHTGAGVDDVMTGSSPTWTAGRTPAYALSGANVNNYPFLSMNPTQFGANAIVGAINVPAASVVDGGQGVLGLATTSSTTTYGVGVAGYANTLVASASVWGANFAASNQINPNSTTGVHANSIIGLELDVNVMSGGANQVLGLQIIGGASTTQPTASHAIDISALGSSSTGVKWGSALTINTAAASVALDIFPTTPGNGFGSQPIQLWTVDSGGQSRQASIGTEADGTMLITGSNGTPPRGVALVGGAGTNLLTVDPTGFVSFIALPVYASNAAAIAGGLTAGRLYKTSTGQVMQVY